MSQTPNPTSGSSSSAVNNKSQESDPTKRNTQSQQNHEKDQQDSELVLAYLSRSGLDTSSLSMDDFDQDSFKFLKEWCDNNSPAIKDSSDTKDNGLGRDSIRRKNFHSENNVSDQGNDRTLPRYFSNNGRIDLETARHHLYRQFMFELNDLTESMMSSPTLRQRHEIQSRTLDMISNPRTSDDNDREPIFYNHTAQHAKKRSFTMEEEGRKDEDDVEELDYSQLEPWQRVLFQKMQRQQNSIETCQKQIDALANVVAMNVAMMQKKEEKEKSNEFFSENISQQRSVPVHPTHEPRAVPQPAGIDHQDGSILSLLERFLDRLFDIPRAAYNYILSTRPMRVLILLRREAQDFRFPFNPNQRFLDIPLMIQLFFMCLFLRARIGSMQKRGYRGIRSEEWGGIVAELMAVWKEHGEMMLVLAAITVYMIRTGMILFLYRVIFKDNVIAKVWRNEDLPLDQDGNLQEDNIGHDEEDQGEVEVAEVNNDDDHDDEEMEEEEDINHNPRHDRRGGDRERRGRRDPGRRIRVDARRPLQDVDGDGNQNIPDNHHHNQGQGNVEVNRRLVGREEEGGGLIPNLQLHNTFVGGGLVDPPFDAENMAHVNAPPEELFLGQMIEGFKDVLYLVGSFFLSVVPLWWPKAREVQPRNAVPPLTGENAVIEQEGREEQMNQAEHPAIIGEEENHENHGNSNRDAVVEDEDGDTDNHHGDQPNRDDQSS